MNIVPEERACVKCGLVKPLTIEFFSRNGTFVDGSIRFRRTCRACRAAQATARYRADREGNAAKRRAHRHAREKRIRELPSSEWDIVRTKKTTRRCVRCHEELPIATSFATPLGSTCLQCIELGKQKREAEAQRRREAPKTCKRCGETKPNNPETFRPRGGGLCRPCERICQKEYRKANPFIHRAKKHRRRARQKAAGGTYNAKDVKAKFHQQGGKCYWCGKKLSGGAGSFEVDHLFPLAKLGENSPRNIVCACRDCNRNKSDKMPWDFVGRLL